MVIVTFVLYSLKNQNFITPCSAIFQSACVANMNVSFPNITKLSGQPHFESVGNPKLLKVHRENLMESKSIDRCNKPTVIMDSNTIFSASDLHCVTTSVYCEVGKSNWLNL